MRFFRHFAGFSIVVLIGLAVFFIWLIYSSNKHTRGHKELGKLVEFTYRPGYGDMEGGYHSETLKRGDDGRWIIECRDQETHSDPTIVTTYQVGTDSETYFEAFIKTEYIPEYSNRKASDDFVTDYSPWSYYMVFEKDTGSGTELQEFTLNEFREYSDEEYTNIKTMKSLFQSLKNTKISEVVEDE